MYKILKIDKGYNDTFFTLKNLETGKEIRCFEPFEYENELKVFHFIKEGGIYDILIDMVADVIDKKEKDCDNYYEILELNVKIGWFKFAKLRLNNEVFYIIMTNLKAISDIENKKMILLRQIYFSLLKVDNVVNDSYKIPNVEIEDLPILLEQAKKNKDTVKTLYYEMFINYLKEQE